MATSKKPRFEKILPDEIKDQHQILTNRVIARMEEAIEYKTPWIVCNQMPMNPVTGTVYKGINSLSLLLANYNDNRFYTYNNVKELAAQSGEDIHVRKGEKGLPIFKALQRVFTKNDKVTSEETKFGFWTQVYAGTVFNASQIEGLAPLPRKEMPEFEVNPGIEQVALAMVEMTGLKIVHHHKGLALYRPSTDELYIPNKQDFLSPSAYYRTLMHELSHASGGPTRLNRNQKGTFGSPDYAFEELVAELSSYFMGNDERIQLKYESMTDDNHVAYLKAWLEKLKEDKHLIFKASSQASKAVEFQFNVRQQHLANPDAAAQSQDELAAQGVEAANASQARKLKMA